MVAKMLFFDYREAEKSFFKKNKFDNFDIKFFDESLNEDTIKKLSQEDLDNTMIISVFITSNICREVISKFKNLRIISTRSTGYDHIESSYCIDKNIAIINVESYGGLSVSQFTFGLILMLVRKILPAVESVRSGLFMKEDFTGRNLNDMTLGVVGTGAIGSGVCCIANQLGMRVLAFDVSPKKALTKDYGVEYVELDELLRKSDIVTLHFPYVKENYHLFDDKKFKLMKEGSYFVNVSRGELVNLKDLLKYVKNGKLKGVGLDVVACADWDGFERDKNLEKSSLICLQKSEIIKNLNNFPNVIITPHIAYDTQESVDYILKTTFEGLKDSLTGGKKHRVF